MKAAQVIKIHMILLKYTAALKRHASNLGLGRMSCMFRKFTTYNLGIKLTVVHDILKIHSPNIFRQLAVMKH